jgi:hypothetical protein
MTRIERFVRTELGCACPAEVFADIRVVAQPSTPPGLPADYGIEIGGRLLILMCQPERWQEAADALPQLVRWGRRERDRRGFNRFRLVVPARDPAAARGVLESAFAGWGGSDERLHLHVIGLDALTGLSSEEDQSP